MRFAKLALATACALITVGAAGAAGAVSDNFPGYFRPRERNPTPWVPNGAREQAEAALTKSLGQDVSARFRSVSAHEVASIRHSQFEDPIKGPVSIVCGQYSELDGKGDYGGYAWFLVAIKGRNVLWVTPDTVAGGPGTAYYSCKNAGLAG